MDFPVVVNYEYTNNLYKARRWLESLPDMFAADFEAAPRWTLKEKELILYRLNNFKLSDEERRIYLQQYTANGLSHPSLTYITHLSVGWSDRDSYVIVCDSPAIRTLVFKFLINTDKIQIWHNGLFDWKHILFHTGLMPSKSIDTMLLAKCLLNNANSAKDRVGLKDLMGYKYGAWALAKDEDVYTLENMWNPDMLKYSATDSPATYGLYEDIQKELEKWKI